MYLTWSTVNRVTIEQTDQRRFAVGEADAATGSYGTSVARQDAGQFERSYEISVHSLFSVSKLRHAVLSARRRMTETIFCSKVSVSTINYLGLELAYASELRRKYLELPKPPLAPTCDNATELIGFYTTVRGPLEGPINTDARAALLRITKMMESVTPIWDMKELDELRRILDRLRSVFAEMLLQFDDGAIVRRWIRPFSDWTASGESKR
jgi:hypothetical protein